MDTLAIAYALHDTLYGAQKPASETSYYDAHAPRRPHQFATLIPLVVFIGLFSLTIGLLV